MKTLWIADAHLSTSDPQSPSYESLKELLVQSMEWFDSLVILGDLFELWIGDNEVLTSRHRPLLEVIYRIRDMGKPIHYLKGNHDFLLGQEFENRIGPTVYDKEVILEWDGYRIYASHGESINKQDYGYRVLRKVLRSPRTAAAIRMLDDQTVYNIGMKLATLARGTPLGEEHEERREDLKDLYLKYAKQRLEDNCHAVILAHTHIIQWHVIPFGHREGLFINPGSWLHDRTYLCYQDGSFQLKRFGKSQAEILFDFAFPVD